MYVTLPAQRQAECYQRQIAAAQRRRRLAIWQEHYDRLQRITPRNDEERIAQAEALELLRQARP
ncbi:MAG: hypothetical protein KDI73_02405 [Candidatus Competibacteraceae bacterium]|nr:hypothetical protein [Candidatus Competibacteraceae bacterium]HRY14701.1 hypothetical protein [Candidatus Competibacteraceae bacterium]